MEIVLNRGVTCIVDEDFLESTEGGSLSFDGRYVRVYWANPRRWVYLHRLISGITTHGKKIVVDHINRNKLDNRRENLRIVPHNINNLNSIYKNRCGLKGVTFTKNRKKPFRAELRVRPNRYYLGRYFTAKEAHEAYLLKRNEIFGDIDGIK